MMGKNKWSWRLSGWSICNTLSILRFQRFVFHALWAQVLVFQNKKDLLLITEKHSLNDEERKVKCHKKCFPLGDKYEYPTLTLHISRMTSEAVVR